MSCVILLGIATQNIWYHIVRMPGESFAGAPAPLVRADVNLRKALQRDVNYLTTRVGPRHAGEPAKLNSARDYIRNQLKRAKLDVTLDTFEAAGVQCSNVIGERTGRVDPSRIVIIGAHYDSLPEQVGADDNASGVAVLLALARTTANREFDYTVRFVAFVNEEKPYAGTDAMGSLHYARACRDRGENIAAMISLDGVGYFTDEPRTQAYPAMLGLLYPRTGNFIAMITRIEDGDLLRRAVAAFRDRTQLASVAAALPTALSDISRSDHRSFWLSGYPGLLFTDTLPFRNPHYHTPEDMPDTLNFDAMTRLTRGLVSVLEALLAAPRGGTDTPGDAG